MRYLCMFTCNIIYIRLELTLNIWLKSVLTPDRMLDNGINRLHGGAITSDMRLSTNAYVGC